MTKDEILNMKAGREMDALIAMSLELVKNKGTILEFYAPFSTDISAALEVAEKLSDKWDYALLNNQNFAQYPGQHFGFRMQAIDKNNHIKTIFALGETAPLAICRAALLAVMK